MQLFTYWRSLATFRVRVAMALKGLSAEPHYVDLIAGDQHTDTFIRYNPTRSVPVLIDDDGTVLHQSLAIMEYLDERYPSPPLMPLDAAGRARVRALAQITVADSHPLNVPRVRKQLTLSFGASDDQITAWARHWMGAGLDAYEAHLAQSRATGTYCHGDSVTIADICLASHATGVGLFGGTLDGHPTVQRIVARCLTDERFAAAHPRRQPDAPAGF